MPEAEEIWELWQAVATQWRTGGMGGLIGLDYQALDHVAGWIGIELDEWSFWRINALERHVLRDQAADDNKVDIAEYCAACAASGRNTDCFKCVLKFSRGTDGKQS